MVMETTVKTFLPTEDAPVKPVATLIVDDNAQARSIIHRYLQRYFADETSLEGEADCIEAAVEIIPLVRPQLLFLDVELTDGTGFEILDLLAQQRKAFHVIFVTAHKHYAQRAFQYEAIDYLHKPLISADFIAAVHRAIGRIRAQEEVEHLRNAYASIVAQYEAVSQKAVVPEDSLGDAPLTVLPSALSPSAALINALILSSDNIVPDVLVVRHLSDSEPETRIPITTISHCHADGSYVEIYRVGTTTPIVASWLLKDVEEILVPMGLLRISRSTLIHPAHCRLYPKKIKGKNHLFALLPDSTEVRVEPLYLHKVKQYEMPRR